jgi:hypothetical protein
MSKTSREIRLSEEERRELKTFTGSGMRSAKAHKRAEIILALDTSEGRKPAKEADAAGHIGVSRQTVQNVKKDFLASPDPAAFLRRRQRETPPAPAKITGGAEARIIALACGQPPQGYCSWTLRLLADTRVELQYADSLSRMTVSRLLKNAA